MQFLRLHISNKLPGGADNAETQRSRARVLFLCIGLIVMLLENTGPIPADSYSEYLDWGPRAVFKIKQISTNRQRDSLYTVGRNSN